MTILHQHVLYISPLEICILLCSFGVHCAFCVHFTENIQKKPVFSVKTQEMHKNARDFKKTKEPSKKHRISRNTAGIDTVRLIPVK